MASPSNAGVHNMDLATFKNAFDGGTRPNRFIVTGRLGPNEIDNPLMIKAASMPAQTLGILQVPFRGRIAKLPGDRAYAEWTFTVLDETTHDLRRKFEQWHEVFNRHATNKVDQPFILSGTNTDYYTTWKVIQIDMYGREVRCIELHKCWPQEVGAIDLSYDTADTLTEYSVTLAYDYLTLCDSSGTGIGGNYPSL